MRFACCIACMLEAIRAAGRAAGILPQELFADGAIWVHWLPAIGWLFISARVIAKGTD